MSYKYIDRAAFEIVGPTGLSSVALKVASQLHRSQTGSLYHYTLTILTTITLLLCLKQVWTIFEYTIDYRAFILILISIVFKISLDSNNTSK